MKEQKFFICKHCGNLAGLIENSGVRMVCCGEQMHELVANTVEASAEKHLPVITPIEGGVRVDVGSIAHPMIDAHYIKFIYLQTDKGGMRRVTLPEQSPTATFMLTDEKVISAYAYCNLHGLWKTEV